MRKQFLLLLTLAVLCFLLLPARAQDDGNGRGVVRLAANEFYDGSDARQALLMPRLFDVDPVTGALLGTYKSDKALALVVPPISPLGEATLALRQDRSWSDSEPITAYDVLFSLMWANHSPQDDPLSTVQPISGVRLSAEYTLVLRFAVATDTPKPTPTCDTLPRVNLYLVPYHTVYPDFRKFVDQQTPEDFLSLSEWWENFQDAHLYAEPEPDPVTSGAYRSAGNGQFVPTDGTGAALQRVANLPDTFVRPNTIDALIAGDTDVLLDVPVSERPGLRLLADANKRNFQIAEVPGRESLIILLNFGNPGRPLPGIHPETGEILDQGSNHLFSDPAVRRALQLAIDTPALIDGVMQRSAVPLAGLYPPSSWVFDPSLTRTETNLQEARRLLDAAGWKENGVVRICTGCATAPDGTQLQFALGSSSEDYPLAEQITNQWARIGVSSFVSGEGGFLLASQSFDAYLARMGGNAYEDADPDRTLMLTPVGDVLMQNDVNGGALMNYGSYSNPEVTALLEQARTLPGCDPAGRAAIYHRLEHILQADLPFLSVAAPSEFYAAAPNVLGFAPRTGDPLWNVESWVVAR